MGRKIPAKKHRGVKDPLKQQERRNLVLQSKINAAPTDPDDQPIPKSLTRLFDFKPKVTAKLGSKIKRSNKNKVPKASASAGESGGSERGGSERGAIARMARLPGETAREFQLRVRSALRALTSDSQAEHELHQTLHPDQYHVGSKKEERLEDIRALKQKRREVKARRGAGAGAGAGGASAGQGADNAGGVAGAGAGGRAVRRQRQALRQQERALRKQQEAQQAAAWAPRYERLGFGETAHAPPQRLHAPAPRHRHKLAHKHNGARGLLLEGLLRAPAPAPAAGPEHAQGGGGAGAGAEAGAQGRQERARLEAVAAYRSLRRRPLPPAPRTPASCLVNKVNDS